MLIKNNLELAKFIKGKKVLLLSSLGKDAMACLLWLINYNIEVVSLTLSFQAKNPDDDIYINYLKKLFPKVQFIQHQDTNELNQFRYGIYQSPIAKLIEYNNWEYTEFSRSLLIKELKEKYNCEYICSGESKYESVSRATNFYKKGLLQGDRIYPLGLLTKEQVLTIAKKIKLHPCYRTAKGTYDFPSYYKMRSAFKKNPQYKKNVYSVFPLLECDEFRYEVLLANSKVK